MRIRKLKNILSQRIVVVEKGYLTREELSYLSSFYHVIYLDHHIELVIREKYSGDSKLATLPVLNDEYGLSDLPDYPI